MSLNSKRNLVKEFYFIIIGRSDQAVFEMHLPDKKIEGSRHMGHFIAHAALDIVDQHALTTSHMYLKMVDKFNDWYVSAFLIASGTRFIILHTLRADEGIKRFFQEMYEVYIKFAMNPFYEIDSVIKSNDFEQKATLYAKKFLP